MIQPHFPSVSLSVSFTHDHTHLQQHRKFTHYFVWLHPSAGVLIVLIKLFFRAIFNASLRSESHSVSAHTVYWLAKHSSLWLNAYTTCSFSPC